MHEDKLKLQKTIDDPTLKRKQHINTILSTKITASDSSIKILHSVLKFKLENRSGKRKTLCRCLCVFSILDNCVTFSQNWLPSEYLSSKNCFRFNKKPGFLGPFQQIVCLQVSKQTLSHSLSIVLHTILSISRTCYCW